MENEKKEVSKGTQIDSEFIYKFMNQDQYNRNFADYPNDPLDKKSLKDLQSFNEMYLTLDIREIEVKKLIEKKISNIYLRSIKRNLQFFFWFTVVAIVASVALILIFGNIL